MEEPRNEAGQSAPGDPDGAAAEPPSEAPTPAPTPQTTTTPPADRPKRRVWPIHPLLFAIYPVFFLYGENLGEVALPDLVLPLIVVTLGAAVVYAIARLVLRSSGRAALATTLLVTVFFVYGRVRDVVAGSPIGGGRLLVVAALIVAVGLAAIVLVRRDPRRVNRALDVLGAILVVVAVAGIVVYEVPRALRGPADLGTVAPVAAGGGTTRDIYYIVVEDLGSPKNLVAHFGLTDTHAFDWLSELGFQVPDQSATNYGKTLHMLASTMNMEYLDDVAESVGLDSDDYHPLFRLIDDNAVARFLKTQGYRYVHIGSWWDPTEKSSIADVNYGISAPSDFTSALIKTTMLSDVLPRLPRIGIHLPGTAELSGDGAQYDGARFGFKKIEDVAAAPASGPKFVFAHILIPHDPYVFAADGTRLTPQERAHHTVKQNFLAQALYANSRLKEVATALLSGPEATRPIVIIQTDEGPNPPAFEEDSESFEWADASQDDLEIKYSVLNALYLPGLTDTGVYPQLSTVNTFRLVFSKYFGAALPLLPDKLYTYKDKAHPYVFTDITDRILQ